MAGPNAVWGIDIGQCALKALKLRPAGEGRVEAVAFDLIEHPKILSQPDAEPEELIRAALEKFASRNDWQGDRFVLGVPGQQTFARFCKMPPVEPKKIPDLVRFEASQQIPFDIEDVVWDYQTFSAEDSPDLEVGIFAMRKDLIRKHVDYLTSVGISPAIVQTIPSALYNFCCFDTPPEEGTDTAVVVINVGAQNTDLVVVEPNSAWTRNIPLGGNAFTEALVRAFKLSFAKAENLKRTAATSKYARQIFQAMRPVFSELVAEIQRSLGFYSSTHREVELKRVIALGNAFRLPGLQKYLENNLSIPGGVVRVEKFNKLVPAETLDAAVFNENVLSFGAAYGLALQGLGLARINASLLPTELARAALWKKKRPYFVAAAAALGLAAVMPFMREFLDKQALASPQAQEAVRTAQQAISEAERYKKEFAKVQTNTSEQQRNINALLELCQHKYLLPSVVDVVYEAIPDPNPLLAGVDTPEALKQLVESGQLPRTERRQFLIDSIEVNYVEDIDSFRLPELSAAAPKAETRGPRGRGRRGGGGGGVVNLGGGGVVSLGAGSPYGMPGGRTRRGPQGKKGKETPAGFHVKVSGRLLYGESPTQAVQYLESEYYPNLRAVASRPGLGFYIPEDPEDKSLASFSPPLPRRLVSSAGPRPAGGAVVGAQSAREGAKDPVTGEDMSTDWLIEFSFKIKLGEKPQPEDKPAQPEESKRGRRP